MFESHITVNDSIDNFLEVCKTNGIKPVVIHSDSGSSAPQQIMTAHFHKTECLEIALNEMNHIADSFGKVIRRKLEQIIGKSTEPLPFKYEELHSKFLVESDLDEFLNIVEQFDSHSSVNSLKGSKYRFVTSRNANSHENLLSSLKGKWKYSGTIREVVVFDDNESLDNKWKCVDCPIKRKEIW